VSDSHELAVIGTAEREILRRLCALSQSADQSADLRKSLAAYVWRDPEHRIVFEALGRLAIQLTPSQLREQLPAQATRMGFPDVNWQNYFCADESDSGDLEYLIRQLLASS